MHEEVAASVGKSRTAITNSLRLLKLDPRVQTLLMDGSLSEGHGNLKELDRKPTNRISESLRTKGWSVRKMEAEAKKIQQADLSEKGTPIVMRILNI